MEVYSSNKRFPILEIAKANLKHNALLSIAVSMALCLLTPLFIGTANLDCHDSAMPLEMFVSLIGILLLTPVFQPEQNKEIDDLVSSKYFSATKVYLIRTVSSILTMALLIFLFTAYMKVNNCDVTLILSLGTLSNAVFLGSLGMLASSLSNNTVIGYMPPLLYYTLNIGLGYRLGNFYLFSMSAGKYASKVWLFTAGILLIGLSLLYKIAQRRPLFP